MKHTCIKLETLTKWWTDFMSYTYFASKFYFVSFECHKNSIKDQVWIPRTLDPWSPF
jgi:hypothetical protein